MTATIVAPDDALPNCTYRYDLNDSVIRALSLYLDGPFTLVAALLALVGANFAIKFLAQAGLNRGLTAALYTLCVCDAFLIFTVMLYHSIEATGILVAGRNIMWDEQRLVLYTHGLVSAATTASTLLVVFITFQRFLVVIWPLRYARVCERRRGESLFRRTSSTDTRSADASHNVLIARHCNSKNFVQSRKKSLSIVKRIRPFLVPTLVVFVAFLLNSTVFFEFELADCLMWEKCVQSQHLYPTELRQSQTYNVIRTIMMMSTQTVGPISIITLLTIVTEYKVHLSLRARRTLFASQNRRRSLVLLEELRERLSRTVAIFITVKFLILRSLPIFFDAYETFYGIESFGIVLSVLVRLSDFGIVLNAATNSLAYFGKARWLEMKLRDRLLRKRHAPNGGSSNSRWSACSKSFVTGAKPSFDFGGKKTSSATTGVLSPTYPYQNDVAARAGRSLPDSRRSGPTSPKNFVLLPLIGEAGGSSADVTANDAPIVVIVEDGTPSDISIGESSPFSTRSQSTTVIGKADGAQAAPTPLMPQLVMT